uniref:Uncharacterized protein n=1 Tax=Arundo donax TaxID=35708 RepID=A0A0A9CPK4_ARUDO
MFELQIDCAQEDGSVVFQDGSSIKANVIMHCTGYLYDFPFLGDDSTITVDDNCVDPHTSMFFHPMRLLNFPSSDCRGRLFLFRCLNYKASGLLVLYLDGSSFH